VGVTATPGPGSVEPAQLTITYTENDDGWITAQVAEYPAAISQGPTRHEAWVNVLDALHDLTHEPTLTERVAFTVEARLAELGELAAELGNGLAAELGELRDRFVDAAQRDRTGVK
jgi:hypothetical protein